MRYWIGAAAVATAVLAGAGPAQAQTIANVALTTDYVFRGVSRSDNGPAIQGGFEWSSQLLYAGVWASSITEGMEMDLYGGITPSTGPVNWNIGVIGFFYPGADDDGADLDHVELLLAASTALTRQVTIGGAVYYTDDKGANAGEATYWEVNGSYQPMDALSLSASFGNQSIEDPDGLPGGAGRDDYNTWNVGGTYAIHGFTLDLRYHDTDISAGSDIAAYSSGPASYDSAVVFTIGREL